jgi:hypothetical protein
VATASGNGAGNADGKADGKGLSGDRLATIYPEAPDPSATTAEVRSLAVRVQALERAVEVLELVVGRLSPVGIERPARVYPARD